MLGCKAIPNRSAETLGLGIALAHSARLDETQEFNNIRAERQQRTVLKRLILEQLRSGGSRKMSKGHLDKRREKDVPKRTSVATLA